RSIERGGAAQTDGSAALNDRELGAHEQVPTLARFVAREKLVFSALDILFGRRARAVFLCQLFGGAQGRVERTPAELIRRADSDLPRNVCGGIRHSGSAR